MNGLPEVWVAGDNPRLHELAARKGWTVMLTPRHASVPNCSRRATSWRASTPARGSTPSASPSPRSRYVRITDSKTEAASFIENVRYQIRLSQSLRYREELIDGAMLVEKPYKGEPPLEELAGYLLVGDAGMVAERMAALIGAARPKHNLLHFQAGASPQKTALRSIEAFATRVRPMLETALGPLDKIGIARAA